MTARKREGRAVGAGMGIPYHVPHRLMTFIGGAETLGAQGLLLPMLTDILPWQPSPNVGRLELLQ